MTKQMNTDQVCVVLAKWNEKLVKIEQLRFSLGLSDECKLTLRQLHFKNFNMSYSKK